MNRIFRGHWGAPAMFALEGAALDSRSADKPPHLVLLVNERERVRIRFSAAK